MSSTTKDPLNPLPKRSARRVMEKPPTEIKSIQRCFETAPSPKTAQQLEASENISHFLQQDMTTRLFGIELSLAEFKPEDITVTLIRSLRTALIAASKPETNLTLLKKIEFSPSIKFDSVRINMSLDGQLTISAQEGFGLLPPPATETPNQSTVAGSGKTTSALPTDNSFVIDQSKNLDCKLISQGTTPGGSTDMTHEVTTSVSEDGLTWTFELPVPEGYAPEEMSTHFTSETNSVAIVGKRWGVGKVPGKSKWLEFWRKIELPENTKPDSIGLSFSQDKRTLIVTAQMEDSGYVLEKGERKDTAATKSDKLNPLLKRVLP